MTEYTKEEIARMDALGDWGNDTGVKVEDISIPDFISVIQEAYDLKKEKDDLELQVKGVNEQLAKLQLKILNIMEKTNQTSFKTEYGMVVRNKNFSVKHPKDPAERKKFFAYLSEKGVFENMVSVNSQTLNSWYQQEMEAAVESGNTNFSVPGIEPHTYYEKLSMKKG